MDKQAQDKLWNELSEENRKTLQFEYQDYIDDIEDSEVCDIERANLEGRVKVLRAIFGTHNLNPNPIKKEGWVNVYKEIKLYRCKVVYDSDEEAKQNISSILGDYIATVKIEWEE